MISSPRFIRTSLILFALLTPLPVGLATNASAAELLVADRATNSILAFNPTTGAFLRTLVSSNLDEPADLAFGPGGYLYVANRGANEIRVYNPVDGTPIGSGVFASGIDEPGGLLFFNGELLVSEFGNFAGQFIRRYDAGGNLLGTIDAGLQGHAGMTIGPNGNLYATDIQTDGFFSGAIEQFDTSNSFASLGEFATRPVSSFGATGLSGAIGLTFATDDNLYVTGLFSQNLVKFTVAGGVVTDSAMFGGNVAYPSEIMGGPDGNFLVSSLGNNNPGDPIYGNFLFPGSIYKLDPTSGAIVGGLPFITNGDNFQPTALLLSPVPEPATGILLAWGAIGYAARRRPKR